MVTRSLVESLVEMARSAGASRTREPTMNATEGRCYRGQIHALNLQRGSILVVKDGPMRVEYQDGSLDWLPGAAPPYFVNLAEGAQHILPCNAFVKIQTDGPQPVNYVIMRPRSLASHLLGRMNIAWSSRREVSKAAAKTGATLVAALGVLCAFQLESHPSFVVVAILGAIGGSIGYLAGWLFYWTLIRAHVSVGLALWALAAWLAYLVM